MTSATSSLTLARVRRTSLIMQRAILSGAAVVGAGLAWFWLTPGVAESYWPQQLGIDAASVVITPGVRLLSLLIAAVPVAVLFYGLLQAYQLFASYRRGEVFTAAASDRLRRIAVVVIALAAIHPVTVTLLGLAVSWNAPVGKRQLVIQLSSNDLFLAALGGLMLAVAYVMVEAVRIADEHREIV